MRAGVKTWLLGVAVVGYGCSAAAQEPAGAAARSAPLKYDIRNGYNLAFVDADVRRVVDAVLGSMMGVDYSVDPAVSGNVTLRTAKPVTRESLIPLLEDALRSASAVILVQDGRYRVVPRERARSGGAMASEGAELSGYGTEVVTLKNASASELGKLLEQFLGKEAVAAIDPTRNQILISGTESDRSAARTMIARFDVDSLASMNFQAYPLENVDPESLVRDLQAIFKPPFNIIGTRVRLVPLPRLRSVLAIATEAGDLARIEPWIRRLDSGVSGKPRLYSYGVQNGRARDLATALQRVFGTSIAASLSTQNSPSSSTPLSPAGTSSLADGSASQATPEPQPYSAGSDAGFSSTGSIGPRIVPNEETNAILIYADGEQYELIRDALEKLDRPVAQVLIEATLAEVTLTKDFDLGVDWSFLDGKSNFDLRNSATALPAAVFPGFSYGYTSASAKVVLNALQSKTDVKVLSAPRLMVLNNQTATLQVGDQVPIVTQQAQSVVSPGAPIVNNVELRDTGVILKVTPRVNESGVVTLDIAQEVSDVARTTTSGINSPTIQQRRLSSTVTTRSGQMIALGGLIREATTRSKSGVPILSQIPVIGAAFGGQTTNATRTELIILLTPIVMRSPEEAQATVEEIIGRLDQTKPILERARSKQVDGAQTGR
jgi:general secretion pathway protein D